MSWDVMKYKKVLNQIKEDGSLDGTPINSKEEIYDIIAEKIYVNRETAKSWTRPTSTGPKDQEMVRDLEKLLGIECDSLSFETKKEETPKMEVKVLSDVNKRAIFKIYELMKDYLHSDDVDDEDCFSHMWSEVEKHSILVPDELYTKISDFMDNNLAPIIYEREKTYAACYTDEIGHYNDKGIWEVESEEALKKMCMNFMLKNIEIENALDEFAQKELKPYLI